MLRASPFVVYRLWSDGSVDVTSAGGSPCSPTNVCSGPTQVVPASCAADVDHNGEVAVLDLLTVLDEWGQCP